MQLALLLVLLLLGGTKNMEEFRPLIEGIAGEGASEMLKEAEQLSSVVSAFSQPTSDRVESAGQKPAESAMFPLAPVSEIADEGITYCLSRYMSAQS